MNVLICHPHVTRMYLYITRMPLICTRILSDPYGTCMYSYVIRISLICTRLSSVCHSFVLACNPHGARIYSYVIRMSLMYCFTMRVKKLYTLGVSVLHLVTISYFGLFSFDGQLTQFCLLKAFTINSYNQKQKIS